MVDIRITSDPLDIKECIEWIMASECGGVDLFIGRVRSETLGSKVVQLEFEAYVQMAVKELEVITNHVLQNFKVENILIHHRIGVLKVGEIPVIIAVSAPHRDAAFDACRYIIDTLKRTVPIWKKEIYEEGQMWVSAHP
jgi:molybdopterin synthase catalytic subunit